MGLLRNAIFRHSGESRNPELFDFNRLMDTGDRGRNARGSVRAQLGSTFRRYDDFNVFRNSPIITIINYLINAK